VIHEWHIVLACGAALASSGCVVSAHERVVRDVRLSPDGVLVIERCDLYHDTSGAFRTERCERERLVRP